MFEYNCFKDNLSKWYSVSARDLPWRKNKNPYRVWLSEVILQQTQVKQGLPYFHDFIDRYPTVFDLAAAPLDDILRVWQGLGYYSRARNLHVCAQQIIDLHGGEFPESFDALLQLKGIGKYTAAAIASICFNIPVPTVDGNVYRFISRHFLIEKDIAKPATFKVFFDFLLTVIDKKDPGTFNQAMMEIGALVCTPQKPSCNICVFKTSCKAYEKKLVQTLPIKIKKIKKTIRYFNYVIIEWNKSFFLRPRTRKDIWMGLYEYWMLETPKEVSDHVTAKFLTQKDGNMLGQFVGDPYQVKHLLTHQTLYIKIYHWQPRQNPSNLLVKDGFMAYRQHELKKLGLPIVLAQYNEKILVK